MALLIVFALGTWLYQAEQPRCADPAVTVDTRCKPREEAPPQPAKEVRRADR